MGFSRQYFKDDNFLLTRVAGDIDGAILMQHVIRLNKETEGTRNLRELADCRGVTSLKSLTTQMTTMSAGSEIDKPGSRLAILIPENNDLIYGVANAYRMFAEDHREAAKIFIDLPEAILWLSESNVEAETLLALVNNA